jgi:hypothetical protein
MVARAEGDRAPRGSAAMNMYILSPASWSSVWFQVQDEPRERERELKKKSPTWQRTAGRRRPTR